jgi:hypothetical protein
LIDPESVEVPSLAAQGYLEHDMGREICIANDGNTDVQLIYATSKDLACVVDTLRKPIMRHSRQAMPLTINTIGGVPGVYNVLSEIQTSSTAMPNLSVPIQYEVVA